MKKSRRYITSLFLTMIYLVIVLSPLALFAMNSEVVAHAVTGECSGDCDICGCSLENRANHTCCCVKKKQMQTGVKISAEECSSSKGATAPAAAEGTASQSAEPVVAKKKCCSKTVQHPHDEKAQVPDQKAAATKTETVYKCGCPCGKGKPLALTGFGSNELLPINAHDRIEISHVETLYADLSHRLASRHGEPPDPPPRLSLIF